MTIQSQQLVKIGLGEAVKRLIEVEFNYRMGVGSLPENLLVERRLLLEAMDHLRIEISFDCNGDGIPDTVEIFHKTAGTSCCRLQQYSAASSRKPLVSPEKKKKISPPKEEIITQPETSPAPAEVQKAPKKKFLGVF